MNAALSAGPLAEVTRSVLGDAAFLFCDEVPADAPLLEGRLAEATLFFEAPCSGHLTLRLPWSVALDAAANLLGTDRDDPEAEAGALAAAGELLNIITGSALQRWFGSSAVWSIGVPSTCERVGQLPSSSAAGALVAFVIDDARIEIEAIEGGRG
ncbi:MAG: chemotaxis protein CheX [Archangium sp.]|nr:chemotaxis protein CheX [Archangium sp.]